jgi:hypothetical protein
MDSLTPYKRMKTFFTILLLGKLKNSKHVNSKQLGVSLDGL